MRNLCEKHHLTYIGDRCPMCEKERIASFKVRKHDNVIVGQASRDLYFEEYQPQETVTITDSDMEAMLLEKFGKVSKI